MIATPDQQEQFENLVHEYMISAGHKRRKKRFYELFAATEEQLVQKFLQLNRGMRDYKGLYNVDIQMRILSLDVFTNKCLEKYGIESAKRIRENYNKKYSACFLTTLSMMSGIDYLTFDSVDPQVGFGRFRDIFETHCLPKLREIHDLQSYHDFIARDIDDDWSTWLFSSEDGRSAAVIATGKMLGKSLDEMLPGLRKYYRFYKHRWVQDMNPELYLKKVYEDAPDTLEELLASYG